VNKLVAVGAVAWLCHMGSASAGVPDWCKDASFDDRYDLKDLSSQDIDNVVSTYAMAACKPTAEAEANKANIDKGRAAWGKKLGMTDGDWADAVAYANVDERSSDPQLSTKDIAKMTPIDQYVAVREGFSENGSRFENPVYLADMFEPNLTELGRLAFIEECTQTPRMEMHDHAVPFAICQADIDAFDAAKFATQIRTSNAHKPEQKMRLRIQAYKLPALLKEHAENIKKIYAKDEAYKKLWDAAKKGRAEWATTFGGNKALLDLAQRMDTYKFTKSRKAFEGCDKDTTAALNAAITAKVSASMFKEQQDIRKDPFAGVATVVGPLMLDIPEIAFVAGPYIICQPERGTAEFLSYYIDKVPGMRGPRGAAFTAITKEKVVLDDMDAKISYPSDWNHPFSASHGAMGSAGGTIKSVKAEDDMLTVELEKLIVKRKECVQSHRTNRLARINRDGSLDYELICDKMGIVSYDETWAPFKINKAYASQLKKGVRFSSVRADKGGADILAVWPSKTAPLPTLVLGAPVK